MNQQHDGDPQQYKLLKNDYQEKSQVITDGNEKVNSQNNEYQINYQLNQPTNNSKNQNAQYGKNAAKQLGNYLRKHIVKKRLTYIPQLAKFVNKKKRNNQAKYTLQDWRQMLLDNNEHYQCNEIVMDYLQNWAYIDILLEYKQKNPIEMIEHIQHFISGCQQPSKLICNKR